MGLKRLIESAPAFRYAWLLQNDIAFESNAQFEHSLDVMRRHAGERNWSITAQQIRRFDAQDQIAFGGALDCYPAPRHKTGLRSRHDWSAASEERWLSFRSVLVCRDLPTKIGLMDPGFDTYYSDSDYCLSAREAGFHVGYTGADSYAFHKGDPDAAPDLERQKVRHRDRLSFWRKWIAGPRHAGYMRLMGGTVPDPVFSVGEIRQRAGMYPELHSWLAIFPEDQLISCRDITEHFRHQTPVSAFSVLCNLTREMTGGS
jgi:GT2 family glycosyltransferase